MATLTSQNLAVAKLYVALMNRAPDANGFTFWVQANASGASLASLAQTMLSSPEALALYPAEQSNAQFVTGFYTSVFGRAPDADGLAFWSAALAAQGGAGSPNARAALVLQIADIASTPLTGKPAGMSDAAYQQTVADRARFINKAEFGVYFASELKSNDLTLAKTALALVTDDASSLTAATNLAKGIVPAEPPVPAPILEITAVDAALDITNKFAAYAYSSATVNATGMDTAQLNAVAAAVDKIATDGITGTVSMASTLNDIELRALLGAKTALAATVNVDASGMGVAQVVALGLGASKIDSLINLPIIQFSDAVITDAVTAGLFTVAAAGSVRLTQAGSASEAELALIAVNLGKVLSLAGVITLTSDTSASTITGLLGARLGGMGDLIAISASGMSAVQIAAVTAGVGAIGTLSVDASVTAPLLSTLLSAPGIGAVNVSVSATDMSVAQLVVLGEGAANVDSLSGLPKLLLAHTLMTDIVTAGLLSKGSNVTVTASGASAVEVSSLVANLSKVAALGIDGTLSLGTADLPSVNAVTLASKLAVGAAVSVTGTALKNTIDLSAWAVNLRVDGAAGADRIVLGTGAETVFIASRDDSRSSPSLTDTDTSNIETIGNFTSQDALRFSSATDMFGAGITIRPGAITANTMVTHAVDVLTLGNLITAANSFNGVVPVVASTSAAPQIYIVHAYTYNTGVTPGGLANKTFLILNDDNPAITLDDTIIAVENYVNTVGTPRFEAGL